jgi:transposase
MLPEEKEMEVLEVYDLTKSYRDTGVLCGVDHHTVARVVAARALGVVVAEPVVGSKVAGAFVDKITEWVERSGGRVRGDVVHEKLVAMGYRGSERTTRRVVAAAKAGYRREHHRVYKPWITEPGAWLQYDFGQGPVIDETEVVLFCAWLAWSRFRVILPLGDKSLPSVITALDRTFRLTGGAPTYVLTDNERTVTDRHIAGIAVRNRTAVDLSRYYGVTIATCVPYDPESKGGSESSVKLAKADLVPTDYNLLEGYRSFAGLEAACRALTAELNSRPHSVTRRAPEETLEVERGHLHAIPLYHRVRRVSQCRLVVRGQLSGRPLLGAGPALRHPGVGACRRRRGGHHLRGGHRRRGGGPSPPPRSRPGLDPRRALHASTNPGPPRPHAQGDQPGRAGLPRFG